MQINYIILGLKRHRTKKLNRKWKELPRKSELFITIFNSYNCLIYSLTIPYLLFVKISTKNMENSDQKKPTPSKLMLDLGQNFSSFRSSCEKCWSNLVEIFWKKTACRPRLTHGPPILDIGLPVAGRLIANQFCNIFQSTNKTHCCIIEI